MGIFGALTTAVAGMRAQSFALENVSGNIANSQTTAFKRMDTSFVDLIPDAQPSRQLAGSVVANARMTNTVQGDIQSSSISTFMAINGDGFFVVQKPRQLHRQPPGLRRHRPLHAARRLPARQERLSGQRRRLLPDGNSGRCDHRQSRRQRSAAPAVPERLPAGAGDDPDRISRQSGDLSADSRCRPRHSAVRTAQPGDLLRQSDRVGAGRRQDHRQWRAACRRHRRRDRHRHVCRSGNHAIGRRQRRHVADHRDAVRRRCHQLRHRARRHRHAQFDRRRDQRHGRSWCGRRRGGFDRYDRRHEQAAAGQRTAPTTTSRSTRSLPTPSPRDWASPKWRIRRPT